MHRDDARSPEGKQTHESGLPQDWEDRLRDRRKRIKQQMKSAHKRMPILAVGMALSVLACTLGLLFVAVVLEVMTAIFDITAPRINPESWFGVCFAVAAVFTFLLGIDGVWLKHLEEQSKESFAFGGRSLGSGRNRVLLQPGPDRLHVRVSTGWSSVLLIFLLAGLAVLAMMITLSELGWAIRVIFTVLGLAFGSFGLLPLLLGWRFDFDRHRQTVKFWNWFEKYELPLSVLAAVESERRDEQFSTMGTTRYFSRRGVASYRAINLRLNDRSNSRVHVMCDKLNGNAAEMLKEFLSADME